MAIYRGPGGPGDAVNDAASEVLLALQAKDAAVAAQVAAEAAQAAAELAETNAETAETNAETAATNAAASAASINPASIVITGGSINGTTIGATTASTGKFSTLEATGVTTVQAGTVSLPAITTTGDTNTGIFFPAADTIAFSEGGVESLRIDSSGNVGIGTSTATDGGVTITTNQTRDGSVNAKLALQSTGSNNYPFLLFSGCSSTTRYGGIIQTTSTSGNTAASNAASIQFPMDSATACHMSFWTNANIGTSNLAERMRITSGGEVCIGTTNSSGTAGIGAKILSTNGGFTFAQVTDKSVNADHLAYNYYSTGAAAYRFYVGAGGTVYATNTTITAISDQRLKENIQDIDVGLNKIIALKPRKFDWKEGKGKNIKGDRGWIAQEFEQVFPEMIDEWRDPAPEGEEPYKAVNADLIPVLVKAIQEQQQIINDLKARIETLESN